MLVIIIKNDKGNIQPRVQIIINISSLITFPLVYFNYICQFFIGYLLND